MATVCCIVSCDERDNPKTAKNKRKVTRPLPKGSLPEGMAADQTETHLICPKCNLTITKFQSGQRQREMRMARRSDVSLPAVPQRAARLSEAEKLHFGGQRVVDAYE